MNKWNKVGVGGFLWLITIAVYQILHDVQRPGETVPIGLALFIVGFTILLLLMATHGDEDGTS